jgi:uncharacterized protein (DUF2236 family)
VTPVLPTREQAAALVPTPASITWRRAGDLRLLVHTSGYALLLQVAHPVVGAGVREHSDFAADPWGRLMRTLDYVNALVYGGPDLAFEMGRRVREMHKRIKGVMPDGTHYHALEPEAYAWVHATLADAIVAGHEHFGRPFTADQRERFWEEWRRLGRLIGVRERDLPAGWGPFREYFHAMVADRLRANPAVYEVLEALQSPVAPPLPGPLGDRAWSIARVPARRLATLGMVGLLPQTLRRRLGLPWSAAQEVELRALGAAARATTPLLPESVRVSGPGYLRLRREAIARGDAAAVARAA